MANVVQIRGPIVALAWWVTREARARGTEPGRGAPPACSASLNMKITAERYAHVTARLQYDAAERFRALVDGPPIELAVVTPR